MMRRPQRTEAAQRLEARSVPSMFDSLEVKVLCTTGWR